MKFNSLFKALVIILTIFVIAGFLYLISPFYYLTVVDIDSGKTLVCFRVKKGDLFSWSYTHSLARTPIEEVFRVEGPQKIGLVKMIYKSYGAGLPELAYNNVHFRADEKGNFILENFNAVYPNLKNFAVPTLFPGILKYKDKNYNLTDIAKGHLVNFEVRKSFCSLFRKQSEGRI